MGEAWTAEGFKSMNGGVLMVYYALPGLYTAQPNTDLNTLAGTSSTFNDFKISVLAFLRFYYYK